MPSVAEHLRSAREQQKLSVHDVAEVTKIRTDHIRALEEGHYDVFAAPVYIRGFVRTYSGMLKLNVAEVLKQLDTELAQTDKFHEPPSLTGRRQGPLDFIMLQLSRVNWRAGFWIASVSLVLLAVAGGYRAWQNYLERDPLADLGPGLYEPSDSGAAEVLPLPEVSNP